MTTTRQRLEAIDDVAQASGKSRDEVLRALWPSWGLGAAEYQQLREAMACTPAPASRAPATRSQGRDAQTEQRLDVMHKLAATSGRSLEEVFESLAPTLGLAPTELAALRHAAGIAVEPPEPSPKASARSLADANDFSARARGEIIDIRTFRMWRDLKATNPHAAALLMNQDADAIQRGRAIDTEPPEPPQAA